MTNLREQTSLFMENRQHEYRTRSTFSYIRSECQRAAHGIWRELEALSKMKKNLAAIVAAG